jgi:hypothetical protein
LYQPELPRSIRKSADNLGKKHLNQYQLIP